VKAEGKRRERIEIGTSQLRGTYNTHWWWMYDLIKGAVWGPAL